MYHFGPFATLALHTALALFILTIAIPAADPARGIVKVGVSDTISGVVARRQLMEEGADDYIHKPLEPARFVARVKSALRRAGA